MDERDAAALIAAAVPGPGGVWADVGAGTGTFTRALCELLGPEARVFAVDRDARALAELADWARSAGADVIPVRADFTRDLDLPGGDDPGLDGMILANALHFVPDPGRVLARLVERVRPGGRVIVVEYDGRPANPWVPHPIPRTALAALAAAAGLTVLEVVATRPSAYGGSIYAAVGTRAARKS
jgi:ubiquinone/menaquinone biosynthesis C-methylase UbiE